MFKSRVEWLRLGNVNIIFLTSVCRADELSDFWFMLSAGRTSCLTFSLCCQLGGRVA
ncbi:hypothetical protein OJ612_08630 [Streptococcus anginosus]|uniref:hypothetical protein n=1 Tax=Streptococcus anginosus TaxID=1328 RepID=UPI0021F8E9D3|nr:hypothetical protein [Streptococcus anginosus]MCW0946354.1 hypothetical protein [Streptococcus anginosus]MCW1022829.1 hypothetical protein [Streptococcus anginosus]MCW1058417.1 hypothetical protein [Streptococcus anginosus]MDU1590884.1 hypothetical protein [Streptococcus anginosus]MED5839298.1 hypothetical protein [Streptococcus anginosus]